MTQVTARRDFMERLGLDYVYSMSLLEQAMTHKSYAADFKNHLPDNERLEFLGDAVLWATINYIYTKIFLN